jgi:hypothetical protein
MSGKAGDLRRHKKPEDGGSYRGDLHNELGIGGGRGLGDPRDENHGHREVASDRGASDFVVKS